jgi:hypothetical protein
MAAETTAGSSPAEEVDVFQGQEPTAAEYNTYRETGELPARFKPAEPPAEETAPADAPEETVEEPEGEEPESEPESDPEETQEPPRKGSSAEKRIKQLLAEKKELERRLEAAAKTDVKPESSPAQAAQQHLPGTRPKPTAEDKDKDGNPKYATYEAWVEDLANWSGEQQLARYQRQQAEQAAINALRTKLDDARTRYEDADEVIFPAAQTIHEANIPQAVKQVIADSDVFPDLCYVLGENREELQKFVALAQNNPRVALAKIFEYERGIREALDGTSAANESGNQAPEPKRTQAPKPPSPVGGASSRSFDANDESLTPEQWAEKRNKQLARK